NKQKVPECFIDLMNKCWDSNPRNRPNISEIETLIRKFYRYDYEFKKQFEEAEKSRKENPLPVENNQLTTHPQAIYTSRLLNPFTKDLLEYNSLVMDFTK